MPSSESSGLVVLTTLTDPSLAEILRIALANEGIDCEIDGAFQAAYPGVLAMRLSVRQEDLHRARAIIDAQANQSMIARSKPMQIVIKNICVPTDFSPHADYAFSYGLNLAKQTGATLHLLHVIKHHEDLAQIQAHPDFTSDSLFVFDFLEKLETGQTEGASEVDAWSDVQITRALRTGKPADAICEYAGAENIDLVVIATHGRSGVERALMGSVAEHVVRQSPCPVLAVRPRQHEFLVAESTSGS